MDFKVTRVDSCNYLITGEGVEISVCSYNPWNSHSSIDKISGKGSRKFKEQIPTLICEFIRKENDDKRNELVSKAESFCKSVKWGDLDNRKLYEVTIRYGYSSQGYKDETTTSVELLSGKRLKQSIRLNNVLNFEEVEVKHDHIYSLGRFIGSGYDRWVRHDKRLFVIMNGVRLTGLAVKEMLTEGESLYDLHRDKRELKHIIEEAKKIY